MITQEEFVRLARANMDAVFRLAFSYMKNQPDADDITQTVLLRLLETNKKFESDAHVKHWLMRVTVNECRKLWRSPWNKNECIEDYENTLTLEEPQDGDLFLAVMNLDEKYRTVLLLHYYDGYSIQEIAEILTVPPGTVGTRLSRAREQLRQYLEDPS